MEWQYPQWLYLILPMAAAWLALALYSRGRRRRAAQAFVAQAMWSRILPADSAPRFWTKTLLRVTAIVTGLVALAGPRYGTRYEEVIPRGSDLYVLIDVSRSMLAQDVPPSRLGRAKADVAALVNRLDGERVGLIAFAGQAVVKCPLTVDYDAFRRSLDELDPASAPRGGTAIGDAIRKALEVFHPNALRDQAILLITDGDDQQSYPLEAAAVAAERHVTIFTVGLGDADHGARIPQGAESRTFLEYQGQQVWSKLDGSLLKAIALKTSGVYVPVGTRAYDLGELYAEHLHGRRGGEGQSQKRIRRADQFQIFLALALLSLVVDLFTRSHPRVTTSHGEVPGPPSGKRGTRAQARDGVLSSATSLAIVAAFAGITRADDPAGSIQQGLRLYRADEFDKAREKFAAARSQFDAQDAGKAAIAAFDEAGAFHRKGDVAHARESYLKAGLAHDRDLAARAHFNLGTLAAEEARRLSGEHPEDVAADKRAEILEQLVAAVASFRHSLELRPKDAGARRDIELVRQWIKYYSDKWHERDRQARRNDSNLIAFLEFMIQTQTSLRTSVQALPATAPTDAFAELKRLQDELEQEIGPLKDKIRSELQAKPAGASVASQPAAAELEKGIALLEGWASAAGENMSSAARQLTDRQAAAAAKLQQSAIGELEKIWDAVIPFNALLGRDLQDQRGIVGNLEPTGSADSQEPKQSASGKPEPDRPIPGKPLQKGVPATAQPAPASDTVDLARLLEDEERTRRRTQLLKPKAEAALAHSEQTPPSGPSAPKQPLNPPSTTGGKAAQPPQATVDPEQLKAGYRKAIELAPRAAGEMARAATALEQKNFRAAYEPAAEALRILEEIQKAQPPPPEQKKQEEDKKSDDKKTQDKKDQQKNDQQKPEQPKDDRDKSDQQKKDQEKKKQEEREKSDAKKQDQKEAQPQISRDQIEEALRKVRERQQEKRERDRRMRANVLGRAPVEKDW